MGRNLGSRYELIERIGAGSMGQVWRARSLVDDGMVAIKLLRAELCGDDELVRRFLQERDILVRLRHPNLVAVQDLVVEADELAIVMDLVDGPNLAGLCASSPTRTLPLSEALELGVQVLAGLDAVHRAGIVHRDVKPENVVVENPGGASPVAKVADFGVAKVAAGATITRMTSLIGTPEYLAPEIIAGGQATPAADVYAVGVVVYELLFGRTPFGGGSLDEVLNAHRTQAPPRPDRVPDEVWAALAAMLAKDPARRPTATGAASLLTKALPAVVGLGPFPAQGTAQASATQLRVRRGESPPEPLPTAPGRRRRLGPRAMVLGLGGAVAAAVAIVAFLPGSGQAQPPNTYSFVPDLLPNGLAVTRTWQLQPDGGAFHGELRLTNTTSMLVSDSFDETIPKSLAKTVDDISFSPAVDVVVKRDPVVRYELKALVPGAVATFAYDIRVPKGGNAFERLKAWADDQAEASGASAGTSLAALSVSPETVTLSPAQRFPLRVRGTMSDETPAPPAVFGGLGWSSADPNVVAVTDGTLSAVGPGTTEITAEAGGLVAKVTVSVGGGEVAAPSSPTTTGNAKPPTAPRPRRPVPAPTNAPQTTLPPTTIGATTTTCPRPPQPTAIGAYHSADGRWNLLNSGVNGGPDVNVLYGAAAFPVVGDWNGDGVDTIGVFYPAEGRWALRNSSSAGAPDITVIYGVPNAAIPVVGDWNGDGIDTIGVFYPAQARWNLRNSNNGGTPDIDVIYGAPNTTWPVAGDWNGDGVDTIGVFSPSDGRWTLRSSSVGGTEITVVFSGLPGPFPVVGDWNGDRVDTVGIFSLTEARWHLRNSNTSGTPHVNVVYGAPNVAWPVVGNWR